MAWPIIAGMAIAAGSSIAGGIFGSMSASAQRKAIRKAAKRSYNDTMDYARDYEKALMDNMTDYERDAAEYRDTQFQRTMANGGIRSDQWNRGALDEIKDYEFGIDKIDYEKEGYKELEKYNGAQDGQWYNKSYQDYLQTKADVKTDKKNTDTLKAAIDDYTGRQAQFSDPNQNTAAVLMRQSASELQKDLNKTYVQGMQQVYYQRKQAYNNYQDMKTQADLYGLQSTLSLWSGLLGAGAAVGQGMVSMYGASGGSGGAGSNVRPAVNTTSPFTQYNYKYLGKGYQY